ncbi:unnamed protein product [Discula destructiva]
MDNASDASNYSSPEHSPNPAQRKPPRADRPCDTCRKRKSRCVKEPDQDKCYLCTFHRRECTYLDEPQRRKKRKAEGPPTNHGPTTAEQAGAVGGRSPQKAKTAATRDRETAKPASRAHAKSLLDRSLGLHRTTHFRYIGPSSVYEARLLDVSPETPGRDADDVSKFRRVDDTTTFLSRSDSRTVLSYEDEEDLEAIEAIVHPYGPALVDLYFRTVHPSYPVLHKGVWLEKYARSFKEFAPPQLAAFYLLAMDWWEYDQRLSSKDKPDGNTLLKAAMKSMTAVLHRPKLATVQAGLLFLQRSGGDSWVLTSQIVAVAEELGLHVDCASWQIPSWEKGLRGRLAWAVYMQDKWGAFIHGRPSHITGGTWRKPQLTLDDFPESAADEDDNEGSTEVETGRLLFIHLTRLTQIMADALETLYGPDQTRNDRIQAEHGIQGLLELVKPLVIRLKQWAEEMPPGLKMGDVKPRKLCSNGNLHLSYFVTEILIYRFIIRRLTPDTTPALRDICREAGKVRLDHAIAFVDSLRPEHLQAFWWFAAPKSLVLIRTYAGLLWATSTTDTEADYYRQKLVDFHWSLKVRSKGVGFVAAAIREMDDAPLDLDMNTSPGVVSGTGPPNQDTIVAAPTQPVDGMSHGMHPAHLALDCHASQPFDGVYPDLGFVPNHLDPQLNYGLMDPDTARHMYMQDVNQGLFYTDIPP